MRQIVLFGWDNSLLSDTSKKAHAAYLDAFSAINSPKADHWLLEDTIAKQGTSPAVIWADTELWGDQGEVAKKAFYESLDKQPILPLREGAKALLIAIQRHGYEAYVVSNKTQSILNYEVCELGVVTIFARLSVLTGHRGQKPNWCKQQWKRQELIPMR